MKLLVAIPTSTHVENETVMSIFNQTDLNFDLRIFASWSVDEGRNNISDYAIDKGYDKVLYLDSDCVLPPNAIELLLADDKSFVAGWGIRKQNRSITNVFREGLVSVTVDEANTLDTLEVVRAYGFHCVMLATELLQRMRKPHFQLTFEGNKCVGGEDVNFCIACPDQKFVDWRVKCGHIVKDVI